MTVSAADDSDFANDEVTLLHTAAGATEYASVTASLKVTVDDDDAENSLPTGVPTISPTAVPEVGVTLTADPSGISDADGPTSPTFSYQWVRVSAANAETDISGATSVTYDGAGSRRGVHPQGEGELHRRQEQGGDQSRARPRRLSP